MLRACLTRRRNRKELPVFGTSALRLISRNALASGTARITLTIDARKSICVKAKATISRSALAAVFDDCQAFREPELSPKRLIKVKHLRQSQARQEPRSPVAANPFRLVTNTLQPRH